MAPLAATLATGVAMGVVGLMLTRSDRERRRDRPERTPRRFGLLAGETLAAGLQRMALEQLDLALGLLDPGQDTHGGRWTSANGSARGSAPASPSQRPRAPDERAIHDTRKAIKRLRALLRLLRGELGERAYEREDEVLRQAAQRLSGARDATVMLATLDSLIELHPRKLGRRRGVLSLRRRLAAESATVAGHTLADPHERAELLGELHGLRWRVSAWSLPTSEGIGLIDGELERIYRQGRSRGRLAARAKGGRRARMQTLHGWRKRVKDLRYTAEMLDRQGSPTSALRKLASRADQLGELLGEDHDLAVLEAHLRNPKGKLWSTGRGTRKALLRAISKRRRALQKRSLRHGERLYSSKPSRFTRRVRAAVS